LPDEETWEPLPDPLLPVPLPELPVEPLPEPLLDFPRPELLPGPPPVPAPLDELLPLLFVAVEPDPLPVPPELELDDAEPEPLPSPPEAAPDGLLPPNPVLCGLA
jgi:hypothetical protein